MTEANLPVASNKGIALIGSAIDVAIVSAVQDLVAGLSHRAEYFDDIAVHLDVSSTPEGQRTCFSYRCLRR